MCSTNRHFLIQLRIDAKYRVDLDEVGRMIDYLGGIASENGYVFHSAKRREEAMQVLSRRYGGRCFTLIDAEGY